MSRCCNCGREMSGGVRASPDMRCKNRWCIDCQGEHGAFFLNWLYWEKRSKRERASMKLHTPLFPVAYGIGDPYAPDPPKGETHEQRGREGRAETEDDGASREPL